MKKILYTFLLVLLSVGLTAQSTSPANQLKGKIIDERNEPLAGVNIKNKNGKIITVSDIDGWFTIDRLAPANQVITIAFLGYKSQEITLAKQTTLTIKLEEDAQNLDEIVVVGYGTQKRSSLTSSIETIKSEDILRMPVANVDQALAGQVAGLSVMSTTGDPTGRESSLSIRGIYGTPLLVIDGIPRHPENTESGETRLSDLNPDDIESISVLKDAAAAAVYGVQAAKGVVLITTKRGKGDKKVRVNYRGQFNLQEATQFPKFLNGYEYAKLYNKAIDNTPETQQIPLTEPELEMILKKSNPNKFADENLFDYLNATGYSTTHSLSATGGNEGISYYISGGYNNTQGLYSGVSRDRYNYSVKLDANLAKGLTFSVDVLGSRSENKNTSYATIDAAYNFSPIQVLKYTDGKLASLGGGNPLIAINGLGGYINNKTSLNTITATVKYELPQIKGLSIYFRGTYDNNNSIVKTFNKPVTLYLPDIKTGEIIEDPKTIYPQAKISLTEKDLFTDNKLLEAGLNYNKTLAIRHDISGLLILNYQDKKNRFISGTSQDMPGPYPEIIGGFTTSPLLSGDEHYTERASIVGRFTYGYNYRYFIEGNFRYDGSTLFHPDNRWGFFPSVSGSWVFSNESFFKNWKQGAISNIKLRASLGLLGDDSSFESYSYIWKYMYSIREGYNIGGNIKPGVVMDISSYPNIDLKWEKRLDYNLATDLGFWDNRLGVTYEYYWRYRSNMLDTAPAYLFPPSSGSNNVLPYINMGKAKYWGWDLTITHKNTINKVKYNIDLTISKTDNVYVDYGDESALDPIRKKVGKSVLAWRLYEADGLFQSYEEIADYKLDQDKQGNATLAPGDIKYKDQNGDHELSDLDKISVKNSSQPDMTFSLKLGANYKGFFVNAMLQGVTGYNQQINEIYSLHENSLQRFQEYHRDNTWTENNPGAEYPRIKFASRNDNNMQPSTFWVKNCDFIRLKSLTVGYSLPTEIVKKMKLSTLSASLQGGNLFTLSSLKNGMDPESLRGYPIQRTYGISLNAGF